MIKLSLLMLMFSITGNAMANSFTYDVQQAGYAVDQYDLKGEASYDLFLKEFRGFPWSEQVGINKGGSEPTISVKNSTTHIDYWVSVIGDSEDFAYLVGIVQPKKVKTWLGLGKEKEVRWVSIYIAEKVDLVESTFQIYFEGDLQKLNDHLAKLPLFMEQEAR